MHCDTDTDIHGDIHGDTVTDIHGDTDTHTLVWLTSVLYSI